MKLKGLMALREDNIIVSSALEVIKGGVATSTTGCNSNSCGNNTGSCQTNNCGINTAICDINDCKLNKGCVSYTNPGHTCPTAGT